MAFVMKARLVCAIIGLPGLSQFAETPAVHAAEPHGMVVTGANDHRRPAGSSAGY